MICKNQEFKTLIDLLEYRAGADSSKTAIRFFENGELETSRITNAEMYSKACLLAEYLSGWRIARQIVLLIQNTSIDYLLSFYAVGLAGGIAVPAYPPRNNRHSLRIHNIIEDTKSEIILTTTANKKKLESFFEESPVRDKLAFICVDEFFERNEVRTGFEFRREISDICFLQYTSGSTGSPKGIVLRHHNLLANIRCTWEQILNEVERPQVVSWLPLFHDMGMIGGVMNPLWGNFPCLLMPPTAFLQKPVRWLKLISVHDGTISPAPNFAYELCLAKIDRESRAQLDLSGWQVALNGSEKVRKETLDDFAEGFAVSGFDKRAFAPCYGLAEATLMVSSVRKEELPACLDLDKQALAANRVVITGEKEKSIPVVSCGSPFANQRVVIIDSEKGTKCGDDEIGEVWVKGKSVADEYWKNLDDSKYAFANQIAGDESGNRFLRSGDLGFIMNGELYITGRMKNMIIIGGQNYYPQDIEKTVEHFTDRIRRNCSAAFSVEKNNSENLVIVAEVERIFWNKWKGQIPAASPAEELNPLTLRKMITRNVSEEFALHISDLVFLQPGKLPKTSSGKIQHLLCKKYYQEGLFSDCSLKIG